MNENLPQLAESARQLAEKKQQEQQLDLYALTREVEQLEDKIAIYRHEALQALPLEEREGVLQEGEPPPLPLPQSRKRKLLNKVQAVVPDFIYKKPPAKTILIIDNGGLTHTIAQLSAFYHVVVWRLEGSHQPLSATPRIERLLTAQFDVALCEQRFQELLAAESPLGLILVDSFVWQAPLVAAAQCYVPVVLCVDQPISEMKHLHWAGMHSKWRIQQSFLWSMQVLCANTFSLDFFLEKKWLPFADFAQMVSPAERIEYWWPEQVASWLKQYEDLLKQAEYLQQKPLDKTFFLGFQHWDSQSTLKHQMMNFLLRWRSRFEARQLVPGLDMACYEQHHPQLGNTNPAVDYLQRGRPEGPWAWPVIEPNPQSQPISERVALHIHAYYLENLPDLLTALGFNTVVPDLYISVRSEADIEVAQQHCEQYPAAVTIRSVPNSGRDIGAFLTGFGAELIADYDIIGHVHTKQSLFHPQRDFISAWQTFLFANVLGTEGKPMADAIVAAMQQDPTLGVVFPDDPNILDWGENKDYAQLLMQHMGLDPELLPENYFKFPVGSMFWIRAEALAPLVSLGLEWHDYPAEPLVQDGSIVHALERFFGLTASLVGLKTGVSYTPGVSR